MLVENVGSVKWEGRLDLREVVHLLDSLVNIAPRSVEVYPPGTRKPAVGYDLNRPATITLCDVLPLNRKTGAPLTDEHSLRQFEVCAATAPGPPGPRAPGSNLTSTPVMCVSAGEAQEEARQRRCGCRTCELGPGNRKLGLPRRALLARPPEGKAELTTNGREPSSNRPLI